MKQKGTAHKERVNQAIAFHQPDRTPRDFAAVPEVWKKLGDHFGTEDRNAILKKLDVDCRIISYDSFCAPPDIAPSDIDLNASQERSSVGGMWRRIQSDGSNRDIWGANRKRVSTSFGKLDEFASFPLETANNLDSLRRYSWPAPEWWNFRSLRAMIEGLDDSEAYNIRYRLGSVFETAWSLYGFERFLSDLATDPTLPLYIMERVTEVHLENLRRVLEIAGDLIDIVYFYDDLASQEGLLVSPAMYRQYIQPFHRRIIDLAMHHGKPTMLHCCGSVYPLIDQLIEMGLNILNPIQPSAKNMHPEKLAQEFGRRVAFHGGIDVQQFLPKATPREVQDKVGYTSDLLGRNGGYILSGSHHFQADVPLENVLAMYSKVA
jgi:uroporphyrinogen decarboxylase